MLTSGTTGFGQLPPYTGGQWTAVKALTRLIREYDLDHAQYACITGKDQCPSERQQGQRYYDRHDTPATGLFTGLSCFRF